MSNITPRPNGSANYNERLKKTISNMEAAEEAMKSAEGKELASIKEKNKRREKNIRGLQNENNEENNS